MFIINLTYKSDIERIDKFLEDHNKFLNKQYALGKFIASGRKIPRTGGIILSKLDNKSELEEIIEKDPFKMNGLADYELTEFVVSKASEEMSVLMK